MKKIILTAYFWLMFTIVTLVSFIILPFFLLVDIVLFRRSIDFAIRWAICIYGWVLVKIVPFLAPVEVESKTEKLPLKAIMVPNHSSAIDPYLFGALLTDVCFVTTWPFKIPIYNFFMRLAKYIDANEGWEKVCQKGAAMLQSGASLVIWPEGHRSRDGRLGRFKNGAFALAVKTGCPLLPICILGSWNFLPPGKRVISPSRIKLVILDPIYPDMYNDQRQEIIRLRKAVQQVIQKTIQENSGQLQQMDYYSKVFERGEKC
jgi:1-acyl-sn-glycerol-3-phosphate acyltransferase